MFKAAESHGDSKWKLDLMLERCRKVSIYCISAEMLHPSLVVGPTAAMTKQLWNFFPFNTDSFSYF